MALAEKHAAERRELERNFAERHGALVRMQGKLRDPRAEAKLRAEHAAAVRAMAARQEQEANTVAPTEGGKPAAPQQPKAEKRQASSNAGE